MSNGRSTSDTGPVLRTLSPALRGLERALRAWLDGPHRYPLSMLARAQLEGLAADLRRQSDALDVDRPLLVVMLMGGTGVGKSTLLNALAGGTIAPASVTRPTTRDPVVYYHESVRPDRLDPALRHCRLVPHDRPELAQKVLVDTPDVDSTELANRDKLLRLLPVADVVLYAGSQEKYHDALVWQQFREQRKRRAFAFVLNKWDRCLHSVANGLRPDEDWLRDLAAEGFQSPLLFRTCAQAWVDFARRKVGAARPAPVAVALSPPPGRDADAVAPAAVVTTGAPAAEAIPGEGGNGVIPPPQAIPSEAAPPAERPDVPEGEQFPELVSWLEKGLTRLEIEAIKARGVSQLLEHLHSALEESAPPDLEEVAARTQAAWLKPLREEARATADVLLNTLDPYQREVEHHFALEGQRRFRGLMAGYLHLVRRVQYVGSNLREHLPFAPKGGKGEDRPAAWDLSLFTRAGSEVAANRQLDARNKALVNRLLVEADTQGYPLAVLTGPVESLALLDWRQRYAQALSEVLAQVEKNWARPRGLRRVVQGVLVWLANWLPPLALLAALVNLLWRFFDPQKVGYQVQLADTLLPLAVVLVVLIILHVLVTLLLPLEWRAIRVEFHDRLEDRLRHDLEGVYAAVPGDVAEALREERRAVEKLAADVREVAAWLERREQSASIAGLYGD